MADKSDLYVYFPVFQRTRRWAELSPEQREQTVAEAQGLLEQGGAVQVRGVYSTAGFRADADLMMWWISPSPDELQARLAAFRRTALGARLRLTHAFMGLHRPAEFNPEHVPAFVQGKAPLRYLCVYPFVRTPEWYLLPPQERAAMLREHGELARPYPDVLANTTSAFGLGDYEWVLAFETEDLGRLVDMIRALRSAKARRYVSLETPFVTGIRKSLAEAVADLG
ncbi:hydrogen peroxide-dependent heme synthase [Geochorda subterranea]|uniref:Coproheme decarboxylase n=1 Tax=Geochorda subterranea TaxID=3109564 RepID=A0ABZ1BR11_9FIRM|nr:hydrogen peroxide-dependent heme synthase [Limnochorda sp. LNt]WRP14945.1 hydrogen peroxide-dependent heme synthase [Limnochorda sp. LNt]